MKCANFAYKKNSPFLGPHHLSIRKTKFLYKEAPSNKMGRQSEPLRDMKDNTAGTGGEGEVESERGGDNGSTIHLESQARVSQKYPG